jgi:hypothetical protein
MVSCAALGYVRRFRYLECDGNLPFLLLLQRQVTHLTPLEIFLGEQL